MLFRTPTLNNREKKALELVDGIRENVKYALRKPNRWLGQLRRNMFARNIRGSNSIEGYNVSAEDAIAAKSRLPRNGKPGRRLRDIGMP
jgi:lysophospholipase L1-like esterase